MGVRLDADRLRTYQRGPAFVFPRIAAFDDAKVEATLIRRSENQRPGPHKISTRSVQASLVILKILAPMRMPSSIVRLDRPEIAAREAERGSAQGQILSQGPGEMGSHLHRAPTKILSGYVQALTRRVEM